MFDFHKRVLKCIYPFQPKKSEKNFEEKKKTGWPVTGGATCDASTSFKSKIGIKKRQKNQSPNI